MGRSGNQKLAFAGFRRGGSSIGFEIVQNLLINSGLRCGDPVKELYDLGTSASQITTQLLKPAWGHNDVVGCFRAAPKLRKAELSRIRLFLLVRDPRDCQISWFHARYLHQADAISSPVIEGAKLHESLSRDDFFDHEAASLLDWCELSGGQIYLYEDMVMDPLGFIQSFQEFSGFSLSPTAIDFALVRASFIQGAADSRHHNRSGMPYEALRTLPAEELDALNRRFLPLLERLDYPLNRDAMPSLDFTRFVERDAIKRYLQILATQNGLRIMEIQQLQDEIVKLRDEIKMLKNINH